MQSVVKLGSLFDGSGGFPLAGALNGVTPAWASEVEPYPIRVTKERFPRMKHLGSVTEVSGAEIEPVEIITFGSPCQDLSVAGKQKGIHEGARSSLFFQAVRIIKEMRENDRANGRTGKHIRPRFAVWENVPGAYSSNGGRDFQAVLQALCEIADPAISIPFPEKGKWLNAGCIVGDGFSIAWRTYDAQYWAGTPQRRKRIYLIADFGSERVGEILFERESMPRDSEPGGAPGQGTAKDPGRSAGRSDCIGWDPYNAQLTGSKASTFGTNCGMPSGRNGVIESAVAAFMGGQGAKAHGIAYCDDGTTPTLKATNSGSNQAPDVVYSIEGNIVDRSCAQNGKGWGENQSPSLNTIDRHAVCYSPNGNHCGVFEEAEMAAILQTRYHYGSGGDAALAVYDCRGNGDGKTVPTLTGDHENRETDYTALCIGNGQLNQMSMGDKSNTLDCMHDKQTVMIRSDKPTRKWIVRRLTPLECNRLQGFPDGWGNVSEITDLTDEEHAFWKAVRNTHAAINGKKQADYTKAQMIKWLNALHTDSAEYKMWGNGIALPCARDVIRRISEAISQERGGSST